jgi:hypothetical protein
LQGDLQRLLSTHRHVDVDFDELFRRVVDISVKSPAGQAAPGPPPSGVLAHNGNLFAPLSAPLGDASTSTPASLLDTIGSEANDSRPNSQRQQHGQSSADRNQGGGSSSRPVSANAFSSPFPPDVDLTRALEREWRDTANELRVSQIKNEQLQRELEILQTETRELRSALPMLSFDEATLSQLAASEGAPVKDRLRALQALLSVRPTRGPCA